MKNINIRYMIMSGIILLSLAFTVNIGVAQSDDPTDDTTNEIYEDIAPYEGPIGPSSAFYGLKIAFEDFSEIFTFNESEKIEKQIEHARSRLAEAKTELRSNNKDNANMAIERYREKIQAVDDSVSNTTENVSGLFSAQRKIMKHQFVLERLIQDFPDNEGLNRAFDDSAQLEKRFESRTDRRFMRTFQNGPPIFRQGMEENNYTEVNSRGEENSTRGGYSRKIPPMGLWE
ncbi:MAG: hypothetical protein FIB07_17165 [Candidatus Methanoperedens sp.]|nr:hypothetical protein [Candidatus Methanoperedens sp.]